MHLWDGHVFVVDVFFLPGILLSGLLMCYLAGMYFRYGNIFIAKPVPFSYSISKTYRCFLQVIS